MPAMAALSKEYIFQTSFFATIKSRLRSWHGNSRSDRNQVSTSNVGLIVFNRSNFPEATSDHDSIMQPYIDGCANQEELLSPTRRLETKISVGKSSSDLEAGHITKCVTVEQSST